MPFLFDHEGIKSTENFGEDRSAITLRMPLRELMRNFFDDWKKYYFWIRFISYEMLPYEEADVVRMDILVFDEVMIALLELFLVVVLKKKLESS